MPSLLELQEDFAAALLHGARGDARLAIYRGNWLANASNALACAYPIVRRIVGAEFFNALAREYARAHPSTRGDLHAYGATLPAFLESFAHVQDLPYLADVARMEWLAHRAYYAADARGFDFAAVDPSSAACLRATLAPGCALLASDWALGRIWTVHQDDYTGAIDIDPGAAADRILVYRPGWRVQVRSLAPGDWAFLEAAAGGAALGKMLESAARVERDFQPELALARWVDAGVIVGLR